MFYIFFIGCSYCRRETYFDCLLIITARSESVIGICYYSIFKQYIEQKTHIEHFYTCLASNASDVLSASLNRYWLILTSEINGILFYLTYEYPVHIYW